MEKRNEQITTGYNISLAIWRPKSIYEIFVQGSTAVILLNFCAKNSDFQISLNYRYNKFINLDYFGFLWVPDILILSKLLVNKEIQLDIIERYNSQLLTEESKKDIIDEVEIYKTIDNIINLL